MDKSSIEKEMLRYALPYGAYIHRDGSETLFSRDYKPIATRTPDMLKITPAEGHINFDWQGWFFDDGNPPWGGRGAAGSRRRCEVAMLRFMTGQPVQCMFRKTSKA